MRGRAVAGLVAVLLAAGLGACGDGADGGGAGGKDAAGRPLLPSAAGGGGRGAAGASMQAQVKVAGAADASSEAAPMIAPVRPVEYRLAAGAKAPVTSAPAYRVTKGDDVEVADVLRALGLPADEAENVEIESGLGWFYGGGGDDEAVSSSASGVAVSCAPDSVDCPESEPEPEPEPQPPAGVPTAAEAEARFRKVLESLGVDVGNGELEADDGTDVFARSVRFTPTVDGRPVEGLESTISFAGEGRVEYAEGFTGGFEKLGDYPLVGLEEAFRRFQDGGAGDGGPEPMVAEAGATSAGGGEAAVNPAPAEDDGPVMTIEPQPAPEPVPLEPRIVEITGAEVVLQVVYPMCEDGEYVVVPTYRLQTDDDTEGGFDVPAVADASLDPAADDSAADDAVSCPEDEADDAETDLPADEPGAKPEPATTVDAPAAGSEPGRAGATTGSAGAGGTGSSGSGAAGTKTGGAPGPSSTP